MPALKSAAIASVEVTQFGFGGGTLGDPDEITTDRQAADTLEAAWSAGVRYFDTAPWYGNTKSEHRIGAFLRDKPRDDYVLSTKVGRVYSRPDDPTRFGDTEFARRWKGGLPFILRFDYSASGIRRSYEDSLQRLGINRLDCLVIHDLDPRHQKNEAGVQRSLAELEHGGGYAELRSMRMRGEIGAIGAGINHTGMIPRFLEKFDLDFVLMAMPYTLLDQEALNDELLLCEQRGVKVVVGAVFASGILASGPTPGAQYRYQAAADSVIEKVTRIQALCDTHQISLKAAALQFPLAHPQVVSVIPGANSPEQVRANLAAFSEDIPAEFWQALQSRKLIDERAPLPVK